MLKRFLRWWRKLFSPPVTSRDEILKVSKPKVKETYIEQFNSTVYIRQLSVKDARRLRQETPKGEDEKSLDELTDELEMYYARLMAYCVLDKDYNPIFTLEQVMDFDVDVYNQLFFVITEFNRLNVPVQQVKDELKKSLVGS